MVCFGFGRRVGREALEMKVGGRQRRVVDWIMCGKRREGGR